MINFSISTFCLRCDICSREELNVVHCAALSMGLAFIWSALIPWTNFYEGLSESSKFVATTAVGDDSVCHLVRTEGSPPIVSCGSKNWLPPII